MSKLRDNLPGGQKNLAPDELRNGTTQLPTLNEDSFLPLPATISSLSLHDGEAAFRLAAIVESSDDAIIGKDLNGIVTSWNKAAERIFGYTAEEMTGRSITTLIPPELQSDELLILSKIRAGEKVDHFQTVRLHKSGKRLQISLTVSPIRDQLGNVVGAAKIARDVSRQRETEEMARRLAAIVESSEDAIYSKDLNGTITSWNRGAERIFGYTPEEIIGRPITLIVPPELHANESALLRKIRAGERIDHFQTVRLNKRGDRIHVSLTVSPVKDEHGQIVGAAKIARDITQQKKLEAALYTSERLASVGRLAATVAHEINNPLQAVTNFIHLAKQQSDSSSKIMQYLAEADRELGRVVHLAQQTLGFYRDTSYPVLLPVADVVEDVLAIYERKFKYKELKVERRIEPGLTICTAQGELKQVISNLISNAIDASAKAGKVIVHARASRNFRSDRRGIRITVADTGAGIGREDRDKVFAPFFTTKKDVGTGLGLWITKDLLEKKGGHIHFRSRDSERSGTVMSIYLPTEMPAQGAEHVA
jgi:PAS domain S-box-containing protein